MPGSYQHHLREVYSHYEANDHDLALRRLLDCVIETRNPALFRETLSYCDWLDAHGNEDRAAARDKALQLLEKLGNISITASPDLHSRILATDGVSKAYANGDFRLSELNMELHGGEIIGLVGENGNGKTTLLRLLARELLPDQGKISYHFNPAPGNDYDLKTRLVYIEQRIPRWYGSLMDNLQFALAHYGMKGTENLLWAELMIARIGLRPYRRHSWNRLSSGYRTRFEIAKTLLRQPRVLLLDEPLANLDLISQQTILQDLKFMSRSITAPFGMVLSSQHIYEVEKVSDKIIFLKKGVPQYQQQATQQEETSAPLIFELETEASRETIQEAFAALALEKIQFNGGVYVLHFGSHTAAPSVLHALAQAQVPVVYLRNISHSSRRFFIQ